jgi:hypothetical protein
MNQPVQPGHRNPHRPASVALCHHVIPSSDTAPAHSCGSPALRGESFCFYHHPRRKPVPNRAEQQARTRERRLARRTITVALPQTHAELLGALNQVIALIAANRIDVRRANLLLTTLKAAGNLLE